MNVHCPSKLSESANVNVTSVVPTGKNCPDVWLPEICRIFNCSVLHPTSHVTCSPPWPRGTILWIEGGQQLVRSPAKKIKDVYTPGMCNAKYTHQNPTPVFAWWKTRTFDTWVQIISNYKLLCKNFLREIHLYSRPVPVSF